MMLVPRKSFSENICSLIFSENVRKSYHMSVKGFTYEMTIDFDMFCVLMEDRINSDLHNTGIISMNKSGMMPRKTKFTQ